MPHEPDRRRGIPLAALVTVATAVPLAAPRRNPLRDLLGPPRPLDLALAGADLALTVADFLKGPPPPPLPPLFSRAQLEGKVPEVVALLQEKAPLLEGDLRASFAAGPRGVRVADHGRSIWVETPLLYGRIQDLGGLAGKNHTSLLAGHYYLAKVSAAAGVPVEWAPTQLP